MWQWTSGLVLLTFPRLEGGCYVTMRGGVWSYSALWGQNGVEPLQQGGVEGWGPGVRREKFDWVVLQGAEAFESGHTCLSCERPYSPWLAGIREQRQRERERQCVRRRLKRKFKCKVE